MTASVGAMFKHVLADVRLVKQMPEQRAQRPRDFPVEEWRALMAEIQRCHVAVNNAKLRGKCIAAALAAKRKAEESRDSAIVEFTRVQQETLREVKKFCLWRASLVVCNSACGEALGFKWIYVWTQCMWWCIVREICGEPPWL